MAQWNASGTLIGRGSGGSRKGRHYQTRECPTCKRPVPSNVFPQHVRRHSAKAVTERNVFDEIEARREKRDAQQKAKP